MKYKYLIALLWAALAGVTSYLNLPEILYENCPYSDFCNRTSSLSLNQKGLIPCCSSCKCDEKCGLRLECCFEDMDKYRLKDRGIVACINSYTGDKKDTLSDEGYMMIQTCRNESEDGFQNDKTIPCELYSGKGQSVVEPVSSKETGNIYVNAACAECNNVSVYTKWNYVFRSYYRQRGSLVWEIGNNLENHVGAFAYIPPQHENWSVKRCFKNVKEVTCKNNSAFEGLCKSMQAPYRTNYGLRSKNPFCILCKQEKPRLPDTKCEKDGTKTGARRFTVLIDNSVTEFFNLRKNIVMNKGRKPDCSNEMTMLSDMDSCLTIYCPDGMLMTPSGCRYFIRRWFLPSFYIQFRLWTTVGNDFTIATLKSLTFEERNNPLIWMKIPCRKVRPTVIEVFYGTGKDENQTVESFIVRLWKLTPDGIDPSVVIPTLHKCLKYKWYMAILGKTYSFHATLDTHSGYIQDGLQRLYDKLSDVREDAPRPKLYEHIATGPVQVHSLVVRGSIILKTFFCHQVILTLDDVGVIPGELRILSNNVTLGNNEFTVNFFRTQLSDTKYTNNINKTTFSVCLEDFRKSYFQRSTMGKLSVVKTIVMAQLVFYFGIKRFLI